MQRFDYRAIYIHCDGSMMYDSQSSGGIGYVIKFPEYLELEDVSEHDGYNRLFVTMHNNDTHPRPNRILKKNPGNLGQKRDYYIQFRW
ncbi:hypothetical protein HME9304_00627 [Flagellimonas maritima]|uniref:Uncharacterized protein n=1 Tax=Flagellimonas maritima TaxID=1383885 RepID=A0A2Z4LP93_9FLAO|nr:hypothetical protein HME9304_00627 [Allomuricauda aurantiaca]